MTMGREHKTFVVPPNFSGKTSFPPFGSACSALAEKAARGLSSQPRSPKGLSASVLLSVGAYGPLLASGQRGYLLVGVYYLAPVKVAAAQALNEDFGGGNVGGEGDGITVAETAYLVDLILIAVIVGVAEEDDKVYLVAADAGTHLLAAALICGEAQLNGQTCGVGHQLAGGACGGNGVACQYAAVCDAELHHKLFLTVVCHKRDIHLTTSFQ